MLVCDNLHEVDNVWVVELSEDLDLPHGRDGETFLLILQANLLQRHKRPCTSNTM